MVRQRTQGHSFRLAALNIPNCPFSLCRCWAASRWGIFKGRVMWGTTVTDSSKVFTWLARLMPKWMPVLLITYCVPALHAKRQWESSKGGEGRKGEGKEKIMGARGGRRKGRIEIERGGEREIKVCLREGTWERIRCDGWWWEFGKLAKL